jgi:hypothetical protein
MVFLIAQIFTGWQTGGSNDAEQRSRQESDSLQTEINPTKGETR